MSWTPDLKEQAIALYNEICENEYETDEERSENSTAIVSRVAEKVGKTVNGTRLILKNGTEYHPQKPKTATKAAGTGAAKGAAKMSKADQIQALKDVILTATPEGTELDATILDKLTGKAAAYFTDLFLATQGE